MGIVSGIEKSPVDERTYVFENICNGILPDKFMLKTLESIGQGNTCWCGGFATANMVACDTMSRLGKIKRFSPGFIMKNAKDIDGCKNAKGTTLEALCKVITTKGACEYDLYPFLGDKAEVNNEFINITEEMIINAKEYRADSYARCSGIEGIKQAIYNANGAIISLNVFWNYSSDKRAVIGVPGANDKTKGRHCVFACGWDDNLTIDTPYGKEKGFIVIQESDELKTSANGYRFLPYSAFNAYNKFGDRTFIEAWCTYESKLLEPNYHREKNIEVPDVKREKVYMQLGSKTIKTDKGTIKMDVEPSVIDSTTLLPLRYVGEALEITVTWNVYSKQVKAYDKQTGKLRYFKLNDNRVYDNNGNVILTGITNTQVVNGRTMIPVRLLAESFDCKVDFDRDTKTIIIEK